MFVDLSLINITANIWEKMKKSLVQFVFNPFLESASFGLGYPDSILKRRGIFKKFVKSYFFAFLAANFFEFWKRLQNSKKFITKSKI